MNRRLQPQAQEPQRRNLPERLSQGFRIVRRAPWVILIPILLDLWLTLMPALAPNRWLASISSVVNRFSRAQGQQLWAQANELLQTVDLRSSAVGTYLVPSLFSGAGSPSLHSGAPWLFDGWLTLLLVLGLNVLGLGFSTIVLFWLGRNLDQAQPAWSALPKQLWNLAKLSMIIVGLGLLFGIPAVVAASFLLSASAFGAQLVLAAFGMVLIALWVYASLAPAAIMLGQQSALIALYQSYNLVRQQPREALPLILASGVLIHGTAFLLRPLATNMISILAASALFGLLSCSLQAAKLVFYNERVGSLAHRFPVALTQK
ncbi:hypothetical protein [Herpetosiphon sp. NSE202]|uniref:hypothetical protein n=1 Tax=Herpetosiphon sp. NSE202 TaxID=3351349 RepID=UPI00363AB93B